MSISPERLAALLASIAALTGSINTAINTRTAPNSVLFAGKTLQEVKDEIGAATGEELEAVQLALDEFIARRDNPNQVTKAQVGLGEVENFGTATDAEAVARTAANKFITPKGLGAFWADIVGTAPETLDTIKEIAEALQNNPDVITDILQSIGANAANITALQTAMGTKIDEGDDVSRALNITRPDVDNEGDYLTMTLGDAFAQIDERLEEIGDTSAIGGRLDSLETRATNNEGAIAGIQDRTSALETASGNLSSRVGDVETALEDKASNADLTAGLGSKVSNGANVDTAELTVNRELLTSEDGAEEVSISDALDDVQARATAASAGKLDVSAKASAAEVSTGTDNDKYITAAALKPSQDAQSLAIAANTQSIDDLIVALTNAFNDAAEELDPPQP